MFVMITMTYPPDKAVELAKIFIQIEQESPVSPFIKIVGRFVTSSLESGVKVISIAEIDAGKEDEALKEISKRIVQGFGVEGFRYQIEPVFPAEEAMSMLPL